MGDVTRWAEPIRDKPEMARMSAAKLDEGASSLANRVFLPSARSRLGKGKRDDSQVSSHIFKQEFRISPLELSHPPHAPRAYYTSIG